MAAIAYGLRFAGIDPSAGLLAAGGDAWPLIEVRRGAERPAGGEAHLDTRSALLDVGPKGRRLELDRDRLRATYTGPPLDADELVHPYLGPAATIFGRWLGRETFHAGAFVARGVAWALVGEQEAGKSSLLAALAAAGRPVLADDLVIVHSGRAFAGPRALDLRFPSPGAEPARGGTRWRVRLPAIQAAVPLAGWIFLSWAPVTALTPVPASERLVRLARWRGWQNLESDPSAFLELAALPAWNLRRPRRWAAMESTLAILDELTRSERAPAAA